MKKILIGLLTIGCSLFYSSPASAWTLIEPDAEETSPEARSPELPAESMANTNFVEPIAAQQTVRSYVPAPAPAYYQQPFTRQYQARQPQMPSYMPTNPRIRGYVKGYYTGLYFPCFFDYYGYSYNYGCPQYNGTPAMTNQAQRGAYSRRVY